MCLNGTMTYGLCCPSYLESLDPIVLMSFPANCSDFPNLVTPQAFYPQVVATGIELGRYVTVATAGVRSSRL